MSECLCVCIRACVRGVFVSMCIQSMLSTYAFLKKEYALKDSTE